jgi:hypothetical protein
MLGNVGKGIGAVIAKDMGIGRTPDADGIQYEKKGARHGRPTGPECE